MLLFLQLFGEIWTLKWPPQSAGRCCQASPQCKPRAGGPSPHRSAGSCRTSTGRCGPAGSRGRSQSQSEDFLYNGWQVWSTSEKGWGPMKFLEQGSVLAPSVAFQWNPQFLFASVPTQFNALSLFGLRVFRHIRSWVWNKWCWVFLIKLIKKCFVFAWLSLNFILSTNWVALYSVVCLMSGIGDTQPNLQFFQYIQAYKPFADPVPPNTKHYQLILTKYQPVSS